jgi:hypothetical protein
MKTLMEGAFDERVTPLVTAMAASREGGGTRPPAAQKRTPGVAEETEDALFIFKKFRKLRRVPEDWKFPQCPLATGYELCHCGDKTRGNSWHVAIQDAQN